MKKLLSALLTLTLLLTLAPIVLADSEAYPVEGGNIYIDWSTGTVNGADLSITSAVIPDGVTSIGSRAFWFTNLTSVVIPDSVTSIGRNAFEDCTSLTSVVIPDSVTSIGESAFLRCNKLGQLLVDDGNTSYVSKDGVLFTSDGKSLHTYPAGKSEKTYTIPNGVTSIVDDAFHGCINLTSVVIPNSVTNVGFMAFCGCTSLTSVVIPDSVTSIGLTAFGNCTSLTSVIIPDSVTRIGEFAFSNCSNLTSVVIPDSVTSIEYSTFANCTSLISVVIPDSVTNIGAFAFQGCLSLTSMAIPDGVTSIVNNTFTNCTNLISVVIPKSVTSIGASAFHGSSNLKDVYYSGSEGQWISINIGDYNVPLTSATIHYNFIIPEYLYDTPDPGEDVGDLPEYTAESVTSEASAVEAVEGLAEAMTNEQKQSATGIDLATLLAETAAAKAASQEVTGKEIIINKANVEPLAEKAGLAVDAVDAALVSGGITTARYLSNTVILTSTETGEITIKIDPDILDTEVDKVRVEAPNYALTFKIADIEEDLTDIVTIKASSVGTTVSGGGATARMGAVMMRTLAPSNNSTSVKLDVQNGKLKGPVTISIPDDDGDDSGDTTVSKDDGSAVSSKYNPATSTMDGKVTESGTYTVTTNSKDFTDIGSKSQEMQTAIKYLASKGIISGTSDTTFSPDGEITRAEVAALLVRSLGKLDSAAKSTFDDVKTSDWFYATAASSAKCGYIKGYDDNTFKGKNQILKQETVTVVSRVLQTEMGYKLPTDTAQYLAKYTDTLPNWAKPDIALATRENLIVYRIDGTFSGAKTITRGDAAIILYRMFQKIW